MTALLEWWCACKTQLQSHQMKIACWFVCPTHQMSRWIACRCCHDGSTVSKSVHASRVKERACQPCLNDDVHVKLNCIPPKRRFWKDWQKENPVFEGSTFQGREYSIWAKNHWKVYRQSGFHLLFILPKSSFGEHQLQSHHMKIACWCVFPTNQMCIACRCASRVHMVMLSWWVHRDKERACQPC
jgi:hypothetical protein